MPTTDTVTAILSVVVAVAAIIFAPIIAARTAKRKLSGDIDTSDASVLWQQSQDMRAMYLAEKDKAEEQRDKLIDGYTTQIIPLLAQLNTAVAELAAGTTQALTILRRLEKRTDAK